MSPAPVAATMPRTTLSRAVSPLVALTPAVVTLFAAGCGGTAERSGGEAGGNSAAAAAPAAAPGAASPDQPLDLTEADLDAYERGLQKEIELVRAAQERARTATTPQARAEATQAQWKEQTMPEAARAIGVTPERYQQVRETVHEVLQTLDFQGKIEGPMQMDTARATPEMRARLARDPLAALAPAAAAALRARLDRLAPIFAQYVTLTAVGG
jgi:hypothetical protein